MKSETTTLDYWMIFIYKDILQHFEYTAINDTKKLLNKRNIEYTVITYISHQYRLIIY